MLRTKFKTRLYNRPGEWHLTCAKPTTFFKLIVLTLLFRFVVNHISLFLLGCLPYLLPGLTKQLCMLPNGGCPPITVITCPTESLYRSIRKRFMQVGAGCTCFMVNMAVRPFRGFTPHQLTLCLYTPIQQVYVKRGHCV